MRHCYILVFASTFFLIAPKSARAQDSAPSKLAISVGTGANPLDSIALGLFGLGGRVMLPSEKLTPVFGFQHTSFRGSSFPEDSFGQRDFVRGGTSSAFVGLRGNGMAPEVGAVNPYGIGGAFTSFQRTGAGDTNRANHFSGLGVGGLGGIGADAGITQGAAVGVEMGGMLISYFSASSDTDSSAAYNRSVAVALNTYASVQLTVWR